MKGLCGFPRVCKVDWNVQSYKAMMQDELRVSGMASFTLRFILLRRLAKLGFVAWLVFLVLWGGFCFVVFVCFGLVCLAFLN